MTKIIIEIQEQLYDLWEFRSLERGERYNDDREELDYLLLLNRKAVATNFNEIEFVYPTEELRDKDYKLIRDNLSFFEGVLLIEGNMGLKEIKAALDTKLAPTTPAAEQY